MTKLDPEGFPGLRLYFTEADPSSQALYGLTADEIKIVEDSTRSAPRQRKEDL